jgi:FkbM family methyltransferase
MNRLLARLLSKASHALTRLSSALWLPDGERRLKAWRTPGHRTRQFEYLLDENSFVVDLGGYEGQWTSDIVARYGCHVHVFEPVPQFARAIAARFRKNSLVTVHDFGLGAEAGTLGLTLADDGTSALRGTGVPVDGRVERADDWFAKEAITRVDLMKINIEGAEYELLEHLIETGLVLRIGHIQVQFHDFVSDAPARMKAIQEKLKKTHEPEWQYEFVWESWKLRA